MDSLTQYYEREDERATWEAKRERLSVMLAEADAVLQRAIAECDGGGVLAAQAERDPIVWDIESVDAIIEALA